MTNCLCMTKLCTRRLEIVLPCLDARTFIRVLIIRTFVYRCRTFKKVVERPFLPTPSLCWAGSSYTIKIKTKQPPTQQPAPQTTTTNRFRYNRKEFVARACCRVRRDLLPLLPLLPPLPLAGVVDVISRHDDDAHSFIQRQRSSLLHRLSCASLPPLLLFSVTPPAKEWAFESHISGRSDDSDSDSCGGLQRRGEDDASRKAAKTSFLHWRRHLRRATPPPPLPRCRRPRRRLHHSEQKQQRETFTHRPSSSVASFRRGCLFFVRR